MPKLTVPLRRPLVPFKDVPVGNLFVNEYDLPNCDNQDIWYKTSGGVLLFDTHCQIASPEDNRKVLDLGPLEVDVV